MNDFIQKLKTRFGIKNLIVGFVVVIVVLGIGLQYIGGFNYQSNVSVSTSPGAIDMGYEKALENSRSGYRGGGVTMDSAMLPIPPVPGVPPSTPKNPTADRKVIQNGSLDLLVRSADEAVSGIKSVADTHKGFVDNSNIYEVSEGVKAGSITIRVPAADFSSAMAEIKQLAVKVRTENTTSDDVTAQFVDLEAQLKNYKAEEEQYRGIMAKAVKIEDVLNVASRLSEVRGRIEQTQGQMNYLSRQVDMSSISVSLTSEAEVQVFGIVWRPLTVIKLALKSLLQNLTRLADSIIFFVFQLPVLFIEILLLLFVLWVLWKIFEWARRKFFSNW